MRSVEISSVVRIIEGYSELVERILAHALESGQAQGRPRRYRRRFRWWRVKWLARSDFLVNWMGTKVACKARPAVMEVVHTSTKGPFIDGLNGTQDALRYTGYGSRRFLLDGNAGR